MKKQSLFLLALIGLAFGACEHKTEVTSKLEQSVNMDDFYVYTDDHDNHSHQKVATKKDDRVCYSMRVLNEKLKQNPGLEKKMFDIELHTRKNILAKKGGGGNGNGGGGNGGGGGDTPVDNLGTITIPVYVHVIYSNNQENISDAQINSQMAVLNEDFRKTNNDINQVPSEFAGLAADSEIQYTLAGVTRTASSRTSWGTNDDMKRASAGGVNPITPSTHLNIWVCEIGGGILGYAQFPGGSSSTDGVVVGPQYFGTTGYVAAPFNGGRTLTHEIGHYLNLRHIWGDGRCRQDDFVSDTPSSDGPNYGCPSYPTVNCKSNDMTMNYMDYVNDACMYMFSEGQKSRMRALFAAGGTRESMR
ncbi:zinc metalloprotease [Bernardetia sp. ABR2-2B]|uniref:zinc metalloprotease n=1 Tax=Bernardetia sp. ABR2-2B TaxID=3127472 RepID=UPI0030D365CE